MKLAAVLFFFLALFVQPAYAVVITINGTPQPTPIVTSSVEIRPDTGSHTVVVVNGTAQPAPTHPPTIVTVVVTATPPTVAAYPTYKPVYYAAKYTPTPTFSPTATPSATKTPISTKKPDVKPTQQKPNLFQSIAHFFQNIFSIFKKL